MDLDLVFVVMLIGHILGDFYFQSDTMAEDCQKSIKAVFKHCLVYTVCIFAALFIGIPISSTSIQLCACVSISHLIIDILKYVCRKSDKVFAWLKRNIFIVDQCTHLTILVLCWRYWGQVLYVRGFVEQETTRLPDFPVIILLGALCILQPVNIFIKNTEFWCSKTTPQETNDTQSISTDVKSAGKIIGYLERLIIYVLLLYNQFGAMAFVLTAKSVARFKEIENKTKAEYYLIGTLLSVTSVIVITVILGLCGNGT